MDLAALWQVGSPRTRDLTCAPCIGRGFLTSGPPGKSWLFWVESPAGDAGWEESDFKGPTPGLRPVGL